jgi:hypothetical protein
MFILYNKLDTIALIISKMLGIGDWGLGIGPNPQSPIPNPQPFILSDKDMYYNIYNIVIKHKFIN